jgi:hypothetical protein
VGLGSEDVTQPACNNNYTPANVIGIPIPSAGTLKNFTVSTMGASSIGAITAAVCVNGSCGTPITVTFTPNTTPSTYSDTVDTYPVNANDRVSVQIMLTSGAPLLPASLSIHASLEKQ